MRIFNLFLIEACTAILFSCNFNKSISLDSTLNLKTQGDGISCEKISLTDGNNQELNSTTFTYGQEINLNFQNISGFVEENNLTYPGMRLMVLSSKKDTALYSEDLYADNENGFDIKPLKLLANMTLATPMHSNEKYTAYILIWDKKGKGTFKVEFSFNIVSNPKITVKTKNVDYDEVYLFDQASMKTITNNVVISEQKVFILFEGIKGFTIENDSIKCGISLKVVDNGGHVLLDEADLIGDGAYSAEEFENQVSPYFFVTGNAINSPVSCYCLIWDKLSDKSISAEFKVDVKKAQK